MTQCLIPFRPVGWYVVPHNAFWRHESGDPGVLVPASSVRKVRRREPCAVQRTVGGLYSWEVLVAGEPPERWACTASAAGQPSGTRGDRGGTPAAIGAGTPGPADAPAVRRRRVPKGEG